MRLMATQIPGFLPTKSEATNNKSLATKQETLDNRILLPHGKKRWITKTLAKKQ